MLLKAELINVDYGEYVSVQLKECTKTELKENKRVCKAKLKNIKKISGKAIATITDGKLTYDRAFSIINGKGKLLGVKKGSKIKLEINLSGKYESMYSILNPEQLNNVEAASEILVSFTKTKNLD